MTSLVVDASIALCWCFEEEATAATDQVLEDLRRNVAVVPSHWFLEVTNVLSLSERGRRMTVADVSEFIELLEALNFETDEEGPRHAFGRILGLARSERLTAYDAAYLELAMRLGVPLATKDRKLGEAAERLGVPVIWAT